MFETTHLRLRGTIPRAADADHILELQNDPQVAPWATLNCLIPRHDSEKAELLKQVDTSLRDPKNRNVTVYVSLMPEFGGKRYAYEAMAFIVQHAFDRMGTHKVSLSVMEENERAVGLYKNLGFTEEGRDREVLWRRVSWWDLIRMGILKKEWVEWKKNNPNPAVSS